MQSPIPYTALVDRPALRWPNNARVAVWIQVNLESFEFDKPGISLTQKHPQPLPDVSNAGWRDYGTRVGIFRLMDLLDKYGIRSSTPTNSDVGVNFPEVIREAQKRNWELMGHAVTNSWTLSGLPEDEERAVIRRSLDVLEAATGQRPRGWLGPGLAQTFHTNELLAEAGLDYVSDWCNDDQPYPIPVRSGRLIGVPYCKDIGDIPAFVDAGLPAEAWCRMICDEFDVHHAEGARTGRIFGLALHPFLAGVAFRARWLDEALAHITKHGDIWLATGAEIADWYYANYYDDAVAQVLQRQKQQVLAGA